MSNKLPDDKDGLVELFKKLWLPVAGFIGAVTVAYNFYKLWLGDQATVTYITTGAGFFLLIIALGWIGFRSNITVRDAVWPIGAKREEKIPAYPPFYRKLSKIALGIVFLSLVFGGWKLVQHRKALEGKLVVLIAAFEGPEDVYGLRNEIIENLNANFSDDKEIKIVTVDDIITLTQGSEYAHKLGNRYLADAVIWGWYRPTENPNITVHIENLTPEQIFALEESITLQPLVKLADLESFAFQQQAGQETSALISFLIGTINYKSGNYDAAILRFDDALVNAQGKSGILENQAEIYFYRANANVLSNRMESANQDYDKAIELDPQLANAYNNRGVSYHALGEDKLAIQDHDKAIELDPQSASAYNNRGIAYRALGEDKLAIQDYDKAIELDPQYAVAYINRGAAYLFSGQYERSIQDCNRAIEINPQIAEAYNNRGIVYADLGEFKRAIYDYNKAIQINPQYGAAYYNRGNAYSNSGEPKLAILDYDKAIEIHGSQVVFAYYNRGNVYTSLGEYERAIQDYNKAIEIDPQYADAYHNLGNAYYFLGEYESAIQAYDKAIEINPKHIKAYNSRGNIYDQFGDYERAIQDYNKAIELDPRNATVYYNRGIAYYLIGEYERAIQDYSEAIKIDPQYKAAYKNRGVAYQKLGKTAEAEADFKKYEELTGQKP